MGLTACAALLLLLCNPISSQEKNISTSVLVINSINVFEKSNLGKDILFAFQDAALELKKKADLNAKKFEDEEYDCETCGKKVEGESYGLSYGVMSVALLMN